MVSLLLSSTTSSALRSLTPSASLLASSSSLRPFSSSPSSLGGRPQIHPPFSRPHPDLPYTPRTLPTYPSPLNGPRKEYKKDQRAPWHGPESEFDIDAPINLKEEVMFVNPEHPMYLTEPDAKPSKWFVERTQAGGHLPVYVEYNNVSRTDKETHIRHIEGDPHLFLDHLLRYLVTVRKGERRTVGRVVASSGNVEIKGNYKKEVVEFLLSRGM